MADARAALQDRLRTMFLGELEDGIRVLEDGLARLGAPGHGADGAALLRELFRVAHGIKGAAHSATVPDVLTVARRLEQLLASLRDRTGPVERAELAELHAEVDELTALHARLAAEAPAPSAAGASEPSPPAGERSPGPGAAAGGAVRVAPAKLDVLAATAGDLVGTARAVEVLARELGDLAERSAHAPIDPAELDRLARAAAGSARRLTRSTTDVVERAVDLTLGTFEEACAGLGAAAREVAAPRGREVRLEVVGGDVALDRAVIAALREPLLHLVRNAVDHGIESPEERRAAGKDPVGTVRIAAQVHAGRLEVVVEDDGRGLDVDEVLAAAGVEGDADPLELVFHPGLSTARVVTDSSGRGVGLDAARARVESMGGSLVLEPGRTAGVRAVLRAPNSLTIVRVLVVRAGDDVVTLPVTAVQRLLTVDRGEVREVEGRTVLAVGEEAVAATTLASVLGVPTAELPARLRVVVLAGGERTAALVVDELLDELEVVVKAPPRRMAGIGEVVGIATLPSGQPTVVLNAAACVRAAHATAGALPVVAAPAPSRPSTILLVEDTLTTRALERSILEAAGFEVRVAADGVEALELLLRHGADLVVSDVHMPRMDGLELCRAIRASDRFADLPVVLVTSLGTEDDRRRGLEAGASGYVVKAEFSQETLLDVIARNL